MPIPLPNLDDRRWPDLVDESRNAIPRYAPEWTDHNLHDPGITLIDLFAWLAEMTVYGLNRITARHKRKFLALVGSQPVDPLPAQVMVGFTAAPTVPPVPVPTGTEVEGTDTDGSIVSFRTRRDLTVSPMILAALQVDGGDGTLVDHTRDARDGFALALLGQDVAAGAACYLGFAAIPTAVPVTLGFQFSGPGCGERERRRIVAEAAEQSIACRPVRTRFVCDGDDTSADLVPAAELALHHSARLVWEAFTARGWTELTPAAPDAVVAVEQVFDDTRAFTLDGIVELNLPGDLTPTAVGAVSDALLYVRARLAAGALDAAPMLVNVALNAALADQEVAASETFVIAANVIPGGVAPTPGAPTRLTLTVDERKIIRALNFGTGGGPEFRPWAYTPPNPPALKTGSLTLDAALVGTGTGKPDQAVTLREAPVVGASVHVYMLAGTTWREWHRRDDFDAATRTDAVFTLDPTTGAITFGSGERGRMPEPNALIFASYVVTKAARGNVAANIVTRLRKSPPNAVWLAGLSPAIRAVVTNQSKWSLVNPCAAVGGAAAESLDSAIGRAVEALHAHERLLDTVAERKVDTLDRIERATVRALRPPPRAVNLLDLERVALATPGTRIARARAVASLHPAYPCLDAPGVVSVVIVPEAPPHRPSPSNGLLEAVWRYLDRRRMVCTKLLVVPPQYVEVTVVTEIVTRTGASAVRTADRVREALQSFLDPLLGGPDGLGWPFGRAVYRSEILHAIDEVLGVDHVVSLTLLADKGPAQCGDLVLCPTTLVYSGSHQIEVVV